MLNSLSILPRAAVEHHFEQALEGRFGDRDEFLIRAILDRVRHEQSGGVGTQRARLRLRPVDELCGSNVHRGNTALFEIDRVVHTARRTAASIR